MSSDRLSRMVISTILAIGFVLVPLSISPAGIIEETTACAAGEKCIFEPGSVCDPSGRWDYYTAPTQGTGD